MRETCLYCARKHLGQACALLNEAHQGYPDHLWLAIGHMAEAGDELVAEHPDLAEEVRKHRKALEQNPRHCPPFVPLIAKISARVNRSTSAFPVAARVTSSGGKPR